MSLAAPPAAAILAQEVALPRTPSSPTPSRLERLAGPSSSLRRFLTWYTAAIFLATLVRVICFAPGVLGNYLLKTLGPVEREEVHWRWIVGVRAWDLLMAGWAWKAVKGEARRDGALFGALLTAVSRIPLYAFERSYFLLSTETISTVLLTDIVSIASACALLPILLPHSVEGHSPVSAWQRLMGDRSLAINLLLAFGLATTTGALGGYVLERLGGTRFISKHVYEVFVPSFLSADTMTTAQMMANPSIPIPALRSDLAPQSMPTHLFHSALQTLLAVPLTTILSPLTPLGLGLLGLLLVTPPSTILLHAVLPISFTGAAGAGIALGFRTAGIFGVTAWVLEEMRMRMTTTREERVERRTKVLLVDKTNEVVGVIEEDVVVRRMQKVLPGRTGEVEEWIREEEKEKEEQ